MRPNSWEQVEIMRVPFAEFNCIKLPGSPVNAIYTMLRDMIIGGQAKLSFIVRNRISLDQAPDADREFDQHTNVYQW